MNNKTQNDILVTVICCTFNQEKYISRTIEGMLKQKTSFKYEILIHDDASTDNTPNIIKEYCKKSPLIKPIFQSENQYSKGISITFNILLPLAKGKYLAFCEGDDYWIDENKLQRQVDFLEQNENASMVTHAFLAVDDDGNKILKEYHPKSFDGIISTQTLIEWNFSKIPQYATAMYRKKFYFDMPREFHFVGGIGDYPRYIFFSLVGDVCYLDDVMSCWRVRDKNSWSKRTKSDFNKLIEHNKEIMSFLSYLDLYTNGKYKEDIINKQQKLINKNLYYSGDFKTLSKQPSLKKESKSFRFKVFIGTLFPKTMFKIIKRKHL